ncbi:hypothetical protein BT96DRAFT_367253 [Gymnopus androsaceus JB14]|uniref:Uncharacterized protein n=1 Tax=Gymnopus androsaceus JB14 TaxID=1447944 RepID=A0A6A4IHW0_9AGAR|nr:hypothetical protein BT96DRAFT_367253 [Gymnopus androsaceus JB14]
MHDTVPDPESISECWDRYCSFSLSPLHHYPSLLKPNLSLSLSLSLSSFLTRLPAQGLSTGMASSSSASDNSDLDLGLTFGALEIAIILSSILFGVVTTQTYTYHKNFPADSRWIKYLVNILWLAELGQTICTFHYMYYWSVTGFGNPAFLAKAPVTLGLGTMFYGICVALVQGYFTYRLFKFTSASSILVRLVPITLVVFISARFGVIIAGAIEAIRLPYYIALCTKVALAHRCKSIYWDMHRCHRSCLLWC